MNHIFHDQLCALNSEHVYVNIWKISFTLFKIGVTALIQLSPHPQNHLVIQLTVRDPLRSILSPNLCSFIVTTFHKRLLELLVGQQGCNPWLHTATNLVWNVLFISFHFCITPIKYQLLKYLSTTCQLPINYLSTSILSTPSLSTIFIAN